MMQRLVSQVAPSATDMLRADHMQVAEIFRQYKLDGSPGARQSLVNCALVALEIHARLEEEIFYPAMQLALDDPELMRKSLPDHEAMQQLINRLRAMVPTAHEYNDTFLELMNVVMHHVADEETKLLPKAERLLGPQLQTLGARMALRRLDLSASRAGEMTANALRSVPAAYAMLGSGAMAGTAYLVKRAFGR